MGAVWRDDRNGPRRVAAAADTFPWPAPVTSRAQPAPPTGTIPAQVYERPAASEIQRMKSGRGTITQVGAAGSRPPKVPVDQQPAGEVSWERNAPYQSGLRVHRRNGSAQVQLVPVDPTVADLLGREHFAAEDPTAAPGPVCGCGCGQPLIGGRADRRYLNPAHRIAASKRRRQQAYAL